MLKVIEHSDTSKMDARNCSIVFAPNGTFLSPFGDRYLLLLLTYLIVFAFDGSLDMIDQAIVQTKLVEAFLTHYNAIFNPSQSAEICAPGVVIEQ